MRLLFPNEINNVSAAKFKLHFNIFQLVGGIAVGFIAGGPFGVGVTLSTAIIAQGAGNLYEMGVDEWGNK